MLYYDIIPLNFKGVFMARQKVENSTTILKNIIFRKKKNQGNKQNKSIEYQTINPEDFLLSFIKSQYKNDMEGFLLPNVTSRLLSIVTEMLFYYPYDKVTFNSEGLLCISNNEKFYNLSMEAGNLIRNISKSFSLTRQELNRLFFIAETKKEQDFILDVLTNCMIEEQGLTKALQESQINAVLMTDDEKIKKINEYEAQNEREKLSCTEDMSDYYDEDISSNESGRHDTSVTMSPPVYFNKR